MGRLAGCCRTPRPADGGGPGLVAGRRQRESERRRSLAFALRRLGRRGQTAVKQPVEVIVLRAYDRAEPRAGRGHFLPRRQLPIHHEDDVSALSPGQLAGGATHLLALNSRC